MRSPDAGGTRDGPAPSLPPLPAAGALVAPAPRRPRRTPRRALLASSAALPAAVALGACGGPAAVPEQPSTTPVTLSFLHHDWNPVELDSFKRDTEVYREAGNAHVTFADQLIPYDQLREKTLVLASAGTRPDFYATYALWLREFQRLALLAPVPGTTLTAVKRLYQPSLVEAATLDGKTYGFLRDPQTYQLLYSKQALTRAGFPRPPATWDEWKKAAAAATEQTGDSPRKGLSVITGWDSGVVHPLTALIWSNGGEYATKDGARVAFDQPPAVEALQWQVEQIRAGTALPGPTSAFAQDKTAMIVMANWWKPTLEKAKGAFFDDVGVAPVPHGRGKPVTLMYLWLYGVDAASKAQDQAWRFLTWLNSPKATGESSREGDRLAAKGAIPPATADFTLHQKGALNSPFVQAFIDSLPAARAEAPIFNGDLVKRALQQEVEAAYAGQKTPGQALADAAREANRLIAEGRGG